MQSDRFFFIFCPVFLALSGPALWAEDSRDLGDVQVDQVDQVDQVNRVVRSVLIGRGVAPECARTSGNAASPGSTVRHECPLEVSDWTGAYYHKVVSQKDEHYMGIHGELVIPDFTPDPARYFPSAASDPVHSHSLDSASVYLGLTDCPSELDTGLNYGPVMNGNYFIFVKTADPSSVWRESDHQYQVSDTDPPNLIGPAPEREVLATSREEVFKKLRSLGLQKVYGFIPFARYAQNDWNTKADGTFFLPGEKVSISLKVIDPRKNLFETRVSSSNGLSQELKMTIPKFNPGDCAFKRVNSIDQMRVEERSGAQEEVGNEPHPGHPAPVIPTNAKAMGGKWASVRIITSYPGARSSNLEVPLDVSRAHCWVGKDISRLGKEKMDQLLRTDGIGSNGEEDIDVSGIPH